MLLRISTLEKIQKVSYSLSFPEWKIFVIRHVCCRTSGYLAMVFSHEIYNFLFWTRTSGLEYYAACQVTSLLFVGITQEAESSGKPQTEVWAVRAWTRQC